MRRRLNLFAFALVIGSLAAAGCERFQASAGGQPGALSFLPDRAARLKTDGTATPGQEAIVRTLEADKGQFQAGLATLGADAQPSAVGKFIGDYVQYLETSDASGCPFEFKLARTQHAQAWTLLKTAIERHPDAYDDVEFMTTLALLFHGDKVKGRKLGGDVIDAVARVTETFGELYTRAQGYGVEVE